MLAAEQEQADWARPAPGKGRPSTPACPSHSFPTATAGRARLPALPEPRARPARLPPPHRTPGRGRKWPPGGRSRSRCCSPPPSPATPPATGGAAGSCSGLVSMVIAAGGGSGRPWRRGDVCRDVRGERWREGMAAALTLRLGGRALPAGRGLGRDGRREPGLAEGGCGSSAGPPLP